VRRLEHVGLDPTGRRVDGRRQPAGEFEHPRAVVDPDDLVGPEVPERQGVAPGRALEVNRPAAAAVEIADQLELGRQEVCAAAADQVDRLRQPALVPLGRFVPCQSGGGLHATGVGSLGRGGRSHVLRAISRLVHGREV
jgi:hypothetical protein